ncbi:hypothetical protein B0H10DRAFT_1971495 [Mycena sp. CBHHK59/15]|nr:hypothetical protein B0H10DRAFT_1971495 [Mycena sp. CBHHK59/15]
MGESGVQKRRTSALVSLLTSAKFAVDRQIATECLQDPDTGQVSCSVCHRGHTWIARGSWKKHLDSEGHPVATKRVLEAATAEAQVNLQYGELYNMLPASLQPSSSIQTAPRPQFRPVLDEDSNNIPFGDFHDTIMQKSEAFFQHRHKESIGLQRNTFPRD